MRLFLWLCTGCLFVGIPFLLGYDRYDLWMSVIAGSIGGGVFLAALFASSYKKFPSKKESLFAGFAFFLVAGGFGAHLVIQYRISSYQHELLREIRTVIGVGIITSDKIQRTALPVFSAYHQQSETSQRPIVSVFKDIYGSTLADGMFNKYKQGEMDIMTMVSYQGDSVVQFVCVDTIARGNRSDFINASGHSGRLQFVSLLSKHGVKYERIN